MTVGRCMNCLATRLLAAKQTMQEGFKISWEAFAPTFSQNKSTSDEYETLPAVSRQTSRPADACNPWRSNLGLRGRCSRRSLAFLAALLLFQAQCAKAGEINLNDPIDVSRKLNSGSSTRKFALYSNSRGEESYGDIEGLDETALSSSRDTRSLMKGSKKDKIGRFRRGSDWYDLNQEPQILVRGHLRWEFGHEYGSSKKGKGKGKSKKMMSWKSKKSNGSKWSPVGRPHLNTQISHSFPTSATKIKRGKEDGMVKERAGIQEKGREKGRVAPGLRHLPSVLCPHYLIPRQRRQLIGI
jgi:hypothetical protein